MRIAALRAWIVETPMMQAVTWTIGGTEASTTHLYIELTGDDGRRGLSETVVKPAWTGMDGATALVAVERLVWPRIAGHPLGDMTGSWPGLRGLSVLDAALGHAIRDLEGGAEATSADLAVVLTRAAPEALAEKAAALAGNNGLRAIKLKAGQGLETDRAALAAIRSSLGPDAVISLDANSAYGPADGLTLCRIAADHGAVFVEDPWPLAPDAATGADVAKAALPVCADKALMAANLASGLLDRGIGVLAIKPNRLGPVAASRIAEMAAAAGAGRVKALFGEGPLGALQLLRGPHSDFPVEAGFFMDLDDPIPVDGLVIEQGRISTPAGRAADLVDIGQVAARATARYEAHHA